MRWWRACALVWVAGCCNETLCFGACVDTSTSHEDCGACFNACNDDQTCVAGVCTCPAGLTACGEGCVDVTLDETNCGRCGRGCAAGASCEGGACACPSDRPEVCGSVCVDRARDARNCGTCGFACPDTSMCTAGDCVCRGTSEALCDGVCVDLAVDPANCGACGETCALGCVSGVCRSVTDIAIGLEHFCVLLSDGSVRCEGDNFYGQLGLGSEVRSARFREIPLPIVATEIVAGFWHTCATDGDAVYCWGRGEEGQLGVGVRVGSVFGPALVAGAPSGPHRLSAEWEATCVLGADASVACWGRHQQGLVPEGTGAWLSPTVLTSGPANAVEIGSARVCTRASSGAITCQSDYRDRIDATSFTGASTFAVAGSHACAIVAGDVLCAGRDASGELGNGTITLPSADPIRVPVRARLPERAVEVALVSGGSCALGASGAVYCWGDNGDPYILGVDDSYGSTVPVLVDGAHGDHLFCGPSHCCVIEGPDAVTCWGMSVIDALPRRISL